MLYAKTTGIVDAVKFDGRNVDVVYDFVTQWQEDFEFRVIYVDGKVDCIEIRLDTETPLLKLIYGAYLSCTDGKQYRVTPWNEFERIYTRIEDPDVTSK